ncbi:hypothetical protein DB330_02615 [Lacticaseibacillus casei]|uniref:Uncharacterized protein n=1 Tax=Lacticaseibacillus zeae TaxID=57037 RepID=A0A5R8LT98_LACZE|nr:hypothetical protein [Lacticaseibacillus casei]TLF40481.1 hypothetical protein FEI15_04155 [Lacticaseibacillus zeae]PTU98447.1 hypothetical protein DB330_02615 [Lacticaseibacillus casei]PTU99575.1 hypothetical protein DB326_02470 [Lacticaseibacillus casei]RXS58360.1 hypothetical protein ETB94_02405 [Lacticaseibacillus casei]
MGLSGEIVVGGASFAPPTTRPSFETLPVLQRLKVAPTTLASRRHPSWPESAELGTAWNKLPKILCISRTIPLP